MSLPYFVTAYQEKFFYHRLCYQILLGGPNTGIKEEVEPDSL